MKKDTSTSKIEKTGPRFYASQEEQELSRLKEAIARTDEEKFYFLMNLIKLQLILKKGKVVYKSI